MSKGFRTDLNRGRLGEQYIKAYLSKHGWIVRDVTDSDLYRACDIDIDAYHAKYGTKAIEVKTDYKATFTNNICLEVLSSKAYGSQGCMVKTKADIIAYCIAEGEHIRGVYWIETDRLQRLIDRTPRIGLIDMGDHAKGYLMPFRALESLTWVSYTKA